VEERERQEGRMPIKGGIGRERKERGEREGKVKRGVERRREKYLTPY